MAESLNQMLNRLATKMEKDGLLKKEEKPIETRDSTSTNPKLKFVVRQSSTYRSNSYEKINHAIRHGHAHHYLQRDWSIGILDVASDDLYIQNFMGGMHRGVPDCDSLKIISEDKKVYLGASWISLDKWPLLPGGTSATKEKVKQPKYKSNDWHKEAALRWYAARPEAQTRERPSKRPPGQ